MQAARAETQPACSDGTGQLPSCGALAFPYVAVQGKDPVRYDDQDLPFHKELRSRFPQVDGALLELMALDFAIDELGLYLTTHSDDQQALELYWSYIRLGQEGRKKYQEQCGPLMQTDITPGSYKWLSDPWPWDGKGN